MKRGLAGVCLEFATPLIPGRLIRRYKRFLADVRLDSGEEVLAHCPNTGSMLGCMEPGGEVMLSPADNPARRTAYTWEMSRMNGGWVGINTMLPNRLAALAAERKVIKPFYGTKEVRREVRVGAHTRLDLVVERERGPLYVEVKNVTLVQNGVARFPDAVTARGAKHLEALMELKASGSDVAMLYLVQRFEAASFGPARDIDPHYAELWDQARAAGVEMLVLQAQVSPRRICLQRRLPLKRGK